MSHPDGVEIIVNALKAATAVTALVPATSIVGGQVPAGAKAPMILVRGIARRPSTKPTTQWWDMAVSIDCQSEDPATAYQMACAAEDAINSIVGKNSGGVVQASEATGISIIEDGAFTPPRFRNTITAELTARKP